MLTATLTSDASIGDVRIWFWTAYSSARSRAGWTASSAGKSRKALAPASAAESAARCASLRALKSMPRSIPSAISDISAVMLSATAPVGPSGVLRATYARVKATGVANDATQWALGYAHNLSKRTALYAQFGRISNHGGGKNYHVGLAPSTAGGSSSGFETGLRHSF